MTGLIGKIALTLIEMFIKNEQQKLEYAKRVMKSLEKWNLNVKQSADLRDMFKRIEDKARDEVNNA